ncbi:MAG: hypothetical protein KTR14_02610 [Vampirovibrio sp.]|nr:hypothetical protein [Vampirovibrio sp.]
MIEKPENKFSYQPYRTYLQVVLGGIALFLLLNAILWFGYTRPLFNTHPKVGDLARLGYLVGAANPRVPKNTLPNKHLTTWQPGISPPIDVVTIGDSFFEGKGHGLNNYFQDHLATQYDLTVLHLERYPANTRNPFLTLAHALNSGLLQKIGPKVVILECMDSKVLPNTKAMRASGGFDLETYDNLQALLTYYQAPTATQLEKEGEEAYFKSLPFLNSANSQLVMFNALYPFIDRPFKSQVVWADITTPLFSKAPRKLAFHHNQVEMATRTHAEEVAQANTLVNQAAEALSKQGIRLVFMPVVNKYDLYHPALVDKSHYPKPQFFQHLRPLPRTYALIDTQAILRPAVAKGVVDLYHADDSHWTHRAIEQVVSEIEL